MVYTTHKAPEFEEQLLLIPMVFMVYTTADNHNGFHFRC